MKTFAIKDDTVSRHRALAYLLYYEIAKMFFVEISEQTTEWEAPLLLSSFIKRGQYTVDHFWSRKWVQQRIIPPDRQNLGEILRENGLREYDEFEFLILSDGRCAQDDCYIEPVDADEIYKNMKGRHGKKIRSAVPLQSQDILLFFKDETIKKCGVAEVLSEEKGYSLFREHPDVFQKMKILPGGHGICWGEHLTVSCDKLYQAGVSIPLSPSDFTVFIEHEVISTADAAERLDCTRQNIEDLIRRDKLHPVKVMHKGKLFLHSEVEQRRWK